MKVHFQGVLFSCSFFKNRLFCIADGKEQDSFVVRHPRKTT
nr:MAG TPA: hypothetical protein [Caudoviricetes sp.]